VFIMWNNWVWDSSNNRNLRWWLTWVVTLENAISNTWVLSVNGQTWDVTIDASEASSITTTQPSNPVEWDVYYDTTNDVVKVYDWTNWNVVWDESADINTKTFYLSSTSDLTNAQAIYEWYKSWKNAIVIYVPDISEGNKISGIYVPADNSWSIANVLTLVSTRDGREQGVASFNEWWWLHRYSLNLNISNSAVTSISKTKKSIADFLSTTQTNWAYTPTNNYHPATKKYVDDSVSWAVSKWTTAPSSPVEWQLWYDTTNDVLKSYNWTTWVEVGGWITNDTTWTTSTISQEWVWTKAEFEALSSYWDKIYNIIE